jgi:glycosyltransferase involved in cell wall biosynthesis
MSLDKKPLVSVIMNCFNGERFLSEAIESIYFQTYNNWEIIFWDNVSTDNSQNIAKSYDNRLKYFLSKDHTSLGQARNYALKKATGKYVAFLDVDDIYLKNKLEQQVGVMEKNKYIFSYGSAYIFKKNKALSTKKVKNKSGYIFGNLIRHYEINMQSVMINRGFLVNSNLEFDTTLKYCPDYNLFMKIASENEVGVLSDYLVKYRKVSNSLSSKTLNIVSSEVESSLNEVIENNKIFKYVFKRELVVHRDKLKFYRAVSEIKNNRITKARKILLTIVFNDYKYFLIYIMLFFHVPSRLVLGLINR